MASIITATTTSGLTQSADNSGVLQLASGTGNLVTVPSVTGTAMVSGNMPAFSAYRNSNQSINSNTWTKVQFNNEDFDTNNNFDSTTNYRFTPTVAGYYQISFYWANGSGSTYNYASIYKNGSAFKTNIGNGSGGVGAGISVLVYFNGSTDYVEAYVFSDFGPISGTVSYNGFTGAMVRSA